MGKLSDENKFLDLSDYGRAPGTAIAKQLVNTKYTAVDVTLVFGLCGLISVGAILSGYYLLAGILLIVKSVIDAADGELARLKQKPSYIGRYLDSVFDFIINMLVFLAIAYVTETSLLLTFIAIGCIQLQGTLYHFYYVILRNKSEGGDTTSKIFDYKSPKGLHGESQFWVDALFKCYVVLYGPFDRIIHLFDAQASKVTTFPKWFMTALSLYGLGFQLLIVATFLSLGWIQVIIPFFIAYTVLIVLFVLYRKLFIKN